MELVAPLHRIGPDVPQPSTDVGERLPFAESLLDLGERCLRETALRQLLGHTDSTDELAGRPDDGRDRQSDGHRHTIFAPDLGDDAIYSLTCSDSFFHRLQMITQVWKCERCEGVADDLVLGVSEDSFSAPVPPDDACVRILT